MPPVSAMHADVARDPAAQQRAAERSALDEMKVCLDTKERAARRLQRLVINALRFDDRYRLKRYELAERISVEITLHRGLRYILVYTFIFSLVIVGSLLETSSSGVSVHDTYARVLNLDQAARINTVPELKDFVKNLSASTKSLQALSGKYFASEVEQRILAGFHEFDGPKRMQVEGLAARVSLPAFSLSAWVQTPKRPGGFILRKPMADVGDDAEKNCWGWFFGEKPRLDFGAHDYGSFTSAGQESIQLADWPWADGLHLQTLVVTSNSATFYQDKAFVKTIALSRPITDCSLEVLEVGADRMEIGDVVFHPRELSRSDVEEIYRQGMTLRQIVTGNLPYEVARTSLDSLRIARDFQFRRASFTRQETQELIEQEHMLTRATVAIWNVDSEGKASAGALDPNCSVKGLADTLLQESCYSGGVISVAEHSADDITGLSYFDLLPPSFIGGAASGTRAVVDLSLRRHSFDAAGFPQLGSAWTLSWWSQGARPASGASFLMGQFEDKDANLPCWSLALRMDAVRLYATVDGIAATVLTVKLPPTVDASDFLLLGGQNLRHMAFSVNDTARRGSFYLDGELVGTASFLEEFAGTLDCSFDNYSYLAFAHRPPGTQDFKGDLQQLRLYPGQVLDSGQVADLAFGSRDPNTYANLRECKLPHEGSDSNTFEDLSGHNCGWYAQVMKANPRACANPSVRAACPVACGSGKPCFNMSRAGLDVSVHKVWDRVMWLAPTDNASTDHVVCLAAPADVPSILAHCRSRQDSSSSSSASASVQRAIAREAPGVFLNVNQCDLLEAAVEPLCAFDVRGNWTSAFDAGIVSHGGAFTLTFWIQAAGQAALASEFTPSLQLLASLSPPQPFLSMYAEAGADARVVVMATQHRTGKNEIVEFSGKSLAPGRWTQVAIVFGGRNAEGKRQLLLMLDLQGSAETIDLGTVPWKTPLGRTFLEAVVVSPQVLLGPLEFQARALSAKEVQELFYKRHGDMRLRVGPSSSDAVRTTRKVKYQTKAFASPGFLMAPPLLLQSRAGKLRSCKSGYATWALTDMWSKAVEGPTCQAPYACSRNLLESPLPLISCNREDEGTVDPWFGRQPVPINFGSLDGSFAYPEFLSAVTDVPMLVREGEALSTEDIIDQQTSGLSIIMLLIAADSGILSFLDISAEVRAGAVQMEFKFEQLSGMEGALLHQCLVVQVVSILMSMVLLMNNVHQVRLLRKRLLRSHGRSEMVLVLFDVLLNLGILIHSSWRVSDNFASNGRLQSLVEQIANTPWASKEHDMDQKVDIFFDGVGVFQALLNSDGQGRRLSLLICWAVLLRLIQLTAAHPRTAMLVNTFMKGLDDLWHFLLLFSIMFSAFALLARALFGTVQREFVSLGSTFKVQFLMLLGNVPDNFGVEVEYTVFVLTFIFMMYFFVLNFLLAIVVESYLAVKQIVEDSEAEQAFFADVADLVKLTHHRFRHGWPSPHQILRVLEEQRGRTTAGLDTLRSAGNWSRESRKEFLLHYRRFPFLIPKKRRGSQSSSKPVRGGGTLAAQPGSPEGKAADRQLIASEDASALSPHSAGEAAVAGEAAFFGGLEHELLPERLDDGASVHNLCGGGPPCGIMV